QGVYQIPNLYYKLTIALVGFILCLVSYFTILYINKYRSLKYNWQFSFTNTKLIRTSFWITLLLSAVIGFYLVFSASFEMIIPSALLIYGLFCITINKLTRSNSLILGLFFVLQSFLAVLFPQAAFVLAGIAFGLFHIIYAILRKNATYAPST
ncbi:MAG TPA: hypothetical protein VJ970_00055, partial [Flavobacteriaceae bacterium]|nr:hypothetical protein [Flavobacteriaceae bacterium]